MAKHAELNLGVIYSMIQVKCYVLINIAQSSK
jgi:hypothetical protein